MLPGVLLLRNIIKGVISDKQFLEIKDVVFSKDLEAVFGNTHFKGGKR